MRTLLFLLLSGQCLAAPSAAFWVALHQVESGGRLGRVSWGEYRGPLQISRAYWEDSNVGGSWSDCDDLQKAKLVVEGYMNRYAPRAWATGDVQTLARVHKGGPRGHKKDDTLAYGRRIEMIAYEHNKQTASVLWGKAGVQ
jgi:hypothetical protein